MPTVSDANPRFIRTVTGDIRPEDLGFTHCHEHTFILPGPSSRANPQLLLDDPDKTAAELSDFFAAGGRTVVDAQPIGVERAPRLQRQASERTGVRIVATTGLHRASYYDPDHFRFSEPAHALARRMVNELTAGMAEYDATGAARPTEIRAGVLKFASDYHVIDRHAEKAAEAVAIAHHETGAPIITHTEYGTCGIEQIELFGRLGVPASALLVSHLDRNPDPLLHLEIAESGAYLVYDGVSRVKYYPDSTIISLIRHLVDNGHGQQVLLGMDMGPRGMWRSYGGGPGMSYLARRFTRAMRLSGLDDRQIALFTTINPSAALAFR